MAKTSSLTLFLWGLVGFACYLTFACGPANQSSQYKPPVSYGRASVAKTGAAELTWKITPSAQLVGAADTYWNGYIKSHLNPANYTLTRTDVVPNLLLDVLNIKLSTRYVYVLQTKQNLVKGNYHLSVNALSVGVHDEIDFMVSGLESNSGGDKGNFVPYPKTVKFFPNGVRVEIQDAEIGVPSTVQFKISYPRIESSINGAVEDYAAIDNAWNSLYQDAARGNFEAWYDASYVYYGPNMSLSRTTPLKLTPKLTAWPNDAAGGIRSVLLNAFDPAIDLTTNPNLQPIHSVYSEWTKTPNGYDATYQSYSMIAYLKDLPEPYQPYKMSFTDAQGKVYDSPSFVPRLAFVSSSLQAELNSKTGSPCFLSKDQAKIKCFGDNSFKVTGIDAPLASLPVYQTDYIAFGSPTDTVSAVANNNYTSCVILNLDSTAQTSETRCFGSNNQGNLGIGDPRISPNQEQVGNPDSSTLMLLPAAASNVLPLNSAVLNAKKISANQNFFCAVDFSNLVYCWGNTYIQYGIATQPITLHIITESGKTARIFDLKVGNHPDNCILYQGDTSPVRAACFSVNGSYYNLLGSGAAQITNNHFNYASPGYYITQASPAGLPVAGANTFVDVDLTAVRNVNPQADPVQISVGQGHACVLISDTSSTPIALATIPNNVFCWGENYQGELGLSSNTQNIYPGAQQISNVPMGAIDVAAGSGYTCIITINYILHCVGHTNNGMDPVSFLAQSKACQLDQPNAYGVVDACTNFSNSKFDFGSVVGLSPKVKVIGLAKGDTILCVDLALAVEGATNYAIKCWGNFQINGHMLYTLYGQGNNAHWDYFPVIRW